ncbi:hypothetical protein [Fluviicola taffensis]|uniref:hypothetical protein n=1 Tax=Fluviicola taffensis TaxID=191579 RepID=UPI003137F00F
MHALLEEIAALLVKIMSGEATVNELEAFAAATNQLNERAIILRYKAYEANVYGNTVSEKSTSEAPVIVKEEIVPVIEAQEFHPEQEEEPSFDLFGMDNEEEIEDEVAFELIEDEVEQVIEEEPIEDVIEPVHHQEVVEEKEQEAPELAFAAPIENTQGLHPIYGKLNSNDGTLAARLMSVRLETLKGAFGFNERLQIIQELFNGSNDEFNSLIDQLETIPSKEQARSLVSSYANKYHWDAESQLAIELIQKVERKYA